MPAALRRIFLFLLIFSPAIFTARLVQQKTVDVGCWDMWENAPLLQKWHDGKLTWHDLYAPQIQHRIVVPRLLVIAITHLSGGDFRWHVYFTFVLFLLQAWLLWLLVRRTLGNSTWRWPLMFAINLLLFSPTHYQNLLWGSSMWSTVPIPCLLGVLVLLKPGSAESSTNGGFWWRVAASVLLAEIATHSFAHGLAVWPIVIALIFFTGSVSMRTRWITTGAVFVIAAVTATFYFTDYYNVAHHAYDLKPGDHALKGASSLLEGDHLKVAGRFFAAFIGTWFARSPFVEHPLDTARMLGIGTLLLFGFIAGLVFLYKPLRPHWRAMLPWLALAAWVIGVGLMISKRGADIGEHRAVTPRYLAISVFLLASMIAFVAHAARHSGMAAKIAAPLLAIFCAAQIPVWQYGLHLSDVWYHARRQAQATLLFLPHLPRENYSPEQYKMLVKTLDKDSHDWHCLDAVNTLRGLGLLKFKPLETPELKSFSLVEKPLGVERAGIATATMNSDGTVELSGNARFGAGQPVDAVLFSHGGKVIALGQPAPRNVLRIYGLDYEFANVEDMPVASMYPWKGVIPAAMIPDGTSEIEAWALNAAARRATKIGFVLKLDKAAKTAEIAPTK